MHVTQETTESLLERGFTRRHLGRISRVMAAGVAGLPLFAEFAQAQQAKKPRESPCWRRQGYERSGGGEDYVQ